MGQNTLVTGAHVVVLINGKQYADGVYSFKWDGDTPSDEINTIDVVETIELAPTKRRVTGSIGIYRRIAAAGPEGAGLVAPDGYMQREKYISFMLLERTTGTILFEARKARIEHQSWDFEIKAFVFGTLAFKALRFNNEIRKSDLVLP